jgi:hypothetical protein
MSTRETTVVQVSSGDDIDELIQRLPALEGEHVLVAVDDASDVLLSAAEFYRLVTAARPHNVALTLLSNDELRRRLGAMLGWNIVEPITSSTAPAPVEEPTTATVADSEPTRQPDPAVEPRSFEDHTTADLATYAPTRPRPGAQSSGTGTAPLRPNPIAAPDDPTVPVANVETSRPTRPPRPRTRTEEPLRPPPRRRRARRRLVVALTTTVLLLVAAAVGAAFVLYSVPTATVSLVPAQRTIAADLTYGIPAEGQTFDLTIEPQPITNTINFEKSIPTTGERFVPDGSASGTLTFSNPTTKPVTVASGTVFKAATGMSYVTQSGVTIPAADPFGSGQLGTGSVKIVAAKPGPEGNLDAGTLIGQLDSGLYFTHRDAIAGGTTKRIAVVSAADITQLRTAAESDLAARSEPEFRKLIVDGMQMVPGSVSVAPPAIQFSQEAGADATEVSVKASQTVSARVFEPGKFITQAKDEVGRRLAAQAGSDVILLGDQVNISDPVALPGGTSFAVHAEGLVRAVISEEEQADLARRLVGKSPSEAEAIISSVPNLAQHDLQIQPDWLPRQMPRQASHIKVTVSANGNAVARP